MQRRPRHHKDPASAPGNSIAVPNNQNCCSFNFEFGAEFGVPQIAAAWQRRCMWAPAGSASMLAEASWLQQILVSETLRPDGWAIEPVLRVWNKDNCSSIFLWTFALGTALAISIIINGGIFDPKQFDHVISKVTGPSSDQKTQRQMEASNKPLKSSYFRATGKSTGYSWASGAKLPHTSPFGVPFCNEASDFPP